MVYFSFVSAQHLAEAMMSINSGMEAAQVTVREMANDMAKELFWSSKKTDIMDKVVKYTLGLIEAALGQIAVVLEQ